VQIPYGAQATLNLSRHASESPGLLSLFLDATFDPDPLVTAIRLRHEVDLPEAVALQFQENLQLLDVYELVLALIGTAVDSVAPAIFPQVLGVQAWETFGPVAYLHPVQQNAGQGRGLGNFISVTDYIVDGIDPYLSIGNQSFAAPPTINHSDSGGRSEIVKEWLTGLLWDMGLDGFEEDLASF
jgi:hypothetical protein